MEIVVADYNCVSAAGSDIDALRQSLANGKSGLRPNDLIHSQLETWIGRVEGVEDIDIGPWQSRNNALAELGLMSGSIMANIDRLKSAYCPNRIGIVMGSSTSSIDRTESAYQALGDDGEITSPFFQPQVHNPHAPGIYVAQRTGITGPTMTINTACSSSAKVFASAYRWIQAGFVDAALVGGVDTLCLSVLHGFHSLQLVSRQPCRPFDRHRDGINLGEAAGFAVLVKEDCNIFRNQTDCNIRLAGYGESSDAHHMSHPHPEGKGARLAMEQALRHSDLLPEQINYINLHGTASKANDEIEGKLVQAMFPKSTLCSSTKGWTGHTLGAAGITESIIALDTLHTGILPASLNFEQADTGLSLSLLKKNEVKTVDHVMSNSFGFGGNNSSLIFSRGQN